MEFSEKNLNNYIKCLEKNIEGFENLKEIQLKGIKKDKIKRDIPLQLFNYYIDVWKLEALKVVLKDLQEIIIRQKEEERAEDNSKESFWKEYY